MSPKVGGKHIYETFYHQPSYAHEHEDIRLVPPILAYTGETNMMNLLRRPPLHQEKNH